MIKTNQSAQLERFGGKDKETRRHTTVASGDSETEMPRTPWDGKKEKENKARR
jgi:hypothetical protein